MAISVKINPLFLMMTAAVCASLAFMPRRHAAKRRRIRKRLHRSKDLLRSGWALNIIGVALWTLFLFTVVIWAVISLDLPAWAL